MKEQKYLSKRGWYIYFPMAIIPFIFSFGLLFIYQNSNDYLIPSFYLFVLIYIFLLSSLNTNYLISEENLQLKMSLLKKTIRIKDIKSLTLGNHFWFLGRKFALSSEGIVINSNDFKGILISPENQTKFIDELLKINPSIIIKEKS